MTLIPAAPNTLLLDGHGERPPVPIIGWTMLRPGTTAVPVFPVNREIVPGDGISFGEDFILDLGTGTAFRGPEMLDEWYSFVTVADYGNAPVSAASAPVVAPTPQPPASGKEPFPANMIRWGDKKFVNNSFWHYTHPVSGEQFVFTLPGGEPAPNDPTTVKVNRDAYFDLRRTIAERVIGPASASAAPAAPEEPEDDSDDMI